MKKIYGVYGASGFGREVMPLARSILGTKKNQEYKLMFIDDGLDGSEVNGHKILSFDQFSSLSSDEKYVCLAIASSKLREKLFHKLEENNFKHWSIISEQTLIMDDCTIGENSVLSPFVTLTSNIRIGKSFQANIYSYVAHDCVIGDFVTFAPSVKCNGNVLVGDHAYIGTGAIIKQGSPGKPLTIGSGAIIAAGAVVTKSVPENVTVFGCPAIPLTKENMRKKR